MSDFAKSLRFPLAAYLTSRIVVWAAALTAVTLRNFPAPSLPASSVFGLWDGAWYRAIAQDGYPGTIAESGGRALQSALAFFPLYPLSVRAAVALTNIRLGNALWLVATAYGAIAVCLLWRTTRTLFDDKTADHAALLFAFAPGAFIFSFAYAEGLMLCLSLGCLAALDRRQWTLAGLLGALATMTRPNAIVLAASAAWAAGVAIRDRREWQSVVAPALTPVGMLAFVSYVGVHTGEPGAWWRIQREGWGERIDWGYGVWDDVVNLLFGSRRDLDHVIVCVGVLIVIIGVIALARAKLPAPYVIFCIGILGLALGSENLSARPRFVLTAFPLTIAAARAFQRSTIYLLAASGAGLMALLVVWYGWAPAGIVPP